MCPMIAHTKGTSTSWKFEINIYNYDERLNFSMITNGKIKIPHILETANKRATQPEAWKYTQ